MDELAAQPCTVEFVQSFDKGRTDLPTTVAVAGRAADLLSQGAAAVLPDGVDAELFRGVVRSLSAENGGTATHYYLPSPAAAPVEGHGQQQQAAVRKLSVCVVGTVASRYNSAFRVDQIAQFARSLGDVCLAVVLPGLADLLGAASAVARGTSTFSQKADFKPPRTVAAFFTREGEERWQAVPQAHLKAARATGAAVQMAQHLVDMPANLLDTEAYVSLAKGLAARFDFEITVIQGEDLLRHNLGGIYAVGKAATKPPALVALSKRRPAGSPSESPSEGGSVVFVGKGIVYDTGGLALKPLSGMLDMKADMGGSATVLAGFVAAAQSPLPFDLHCVLCLAENAIGPLALRPSDVIRMHSGKTVEITNPDAEGRLVLADGVSWACQELKPTLLLDMATLTGAQKTATGLRHAAVLTNTAEYEAKVVASGTATGDLVMPILYCPEILLDMFKSSVADYTNSANPIGVAGSSAPGHFIEAHLPKSFQGPWVHIDMASPVKLDKNASGWGVALLLHLTGAWDAMVRE